MQELEALLDLQRRHTLLLDAPPRRSELPARRDAIRGALASAKADLDLAKKDLTFDGLQANSLVLRERARNREITMEQEPWEATRIDDNLFLVVVTFTEGGVHKSHRFDVNIATCNVALIPNAAQPPR